MAFLLDIITPQQKAFEEEVDSIQVPTTEGYVGVLAHHVPLFTILTDGEIKIKSGQREYYLALGGGFMEITGSKVSILVSRAANADELNVEEIKKAESAARDLINKRVKGVELAQAQAILRRSMLDMKVLRHRVHPRNIAS
jgi:F-type H+-transporting ATPase subunit epsilon